MSFVWADWTLFDETTLSFGLARHDFRDYRLDINNSPDFVSQHYTATSPVIQMTGDKEFFEKWHSRWVLDAHYDFNLESENVIANGTYVFDAHSWNVEVKSLVLFNCDPKHGVTVGLGAGVGNFALKTDSSLTSNYVNYTHLIAPILHIEKNYELFKMSGCFSAEVSRLDFYYFQGSGYTFENVIWFKKTPEIEQGLRTQYVYWNLKQGKRRNREWMNDFHGISWTMELKFR